MSEIDVIAAHEHHRPYCRIAAQFPGEPVQFDAHRLIEEVSGRVVEGHREHTIGLIGDQSRRGTHAATTSRTSRTQVRAICPARRTALLTVVQSTLSPVSDGRCRWLTQTSSTDSSE